MRSASTDRRSTWAHRAIRRQKVLVDWALAGRRPLPVPRRLALKVACFLAAVEFRCCIEADGFARLVRGHKGR